MEQGSVSDLAKERGFLKATVRGNQTGRYSETERAGRLVETRGYQRENPTENLKGSCWATGKVVQTAFQREHRLEFRLEFHLVSQRDARKVLNLAAQRVHQKELRWARH